MPKRPVAVFAIDPLVLGEVFPADVIDLLSTYVTLDPDLTLTSFDTPEAKAALLDAEILITGWGCPRIDLDVLGFAHGLRAVVHAAGSVKAHVDPEVFARGIAVSSAAAANAIPVADYTLAAIIFAAKRAVTRARWLAEDREAERWRPHAGTGVYGATVGIIGASTIGRLVLERLVGLDVNILVADPFVGPDEARALNAELVDVETLCRRSDVVSLHAPELPETYHLLDAGRLDLLREGAAVINTARGTLIDTEALTRLCVAGHISAILDVTDPEPLPAGHPLFSLPNVMITPHIAGAQGREQRRLGEFAAAEVSRLIRGEPLRGLVHASELSRIA